MRKLHIAESLDDIRTLQNGKRDEHDSTPIIDRVLLDTGGCRVLIDSDQVSHEFTLVGFIEAMAQECSIDVEVK
jgi:hypothetical protein